MTEFKKVFLDTTPLAYFFNSESPFKDATRRILFFLMENDIEFIISTVTCTEFLVYPYRHKNEETLNQFWQFIHEKNVAVCNVDLAIAVQAAKIRAEYKHFKTMDSIQLATAVVNGCDLFLTNDRQLKQFEEIFCATIEDWNLS